MKKDIYILSGLPGSGKSYFAKNMAMENKGVFVYSQDDKHRGYFDYYSDHILIIDALNNTNESIIKCINELQQHIPQTKYCKVNYKIIRWKENREICLKNDKGRRSVSSENTIKNAVLEEIDLDRIKKETNINDIIVEEKDVVLKPNYFNNINEEKYKINGKYLVSDYWICSGESRSYDSEWNLVYSAITPDDPRDFVELYEFLEETIPNLSFLDFRKITKECVEIITYTDYDYYSTTENAYYRCDLEKMFEIINSKKRK